MIYRNGKLTLEVQNEFRQAGEVIQQKFGAIYQGTKLLWMTVYNAIKSCFGSGTWYGDKPWLGADSWKY